MEQDQKHYYAFISYNHADKKEARDLQRWLVHYTFPRSVRKTRSELPRNISVFRDETHLEVGELSPQIVAALEQSDYLIVVCSPNATKSEWVKDEIEYFRSLGKSDKIIPYIISGIPYAENIEEECYPKALLELSQDKEILGANITDSGMDAAAIRIVAKMFGLRSDILYPELKNEKRRKIIGIAILVVCVFLFICGSASWIYIQKRQIANINWKLQEQLARLITAKASESLKNGDAFTANLLLHEILPCNIDHPEKPLLSETISLLKKTSFHHDDRLIGHKDAVRYVKYSPDGKYIVSASADSTICVWDAQTGAQLKMLTGHKGSVNSLSFSSDGKCLVSCSDDATIRKWNIEDGKNIFTRHGHTNVINAVSFSPNGKYIVSASADSTVRVWDAQTGAQLKMLTGHKGSVNSLSFSSDGKCLITASADCLIRLWEVETWNKVDSIQTDTEVLCASFNPCDSNQIISCIASVGMWAYNEETGEKIPYAQQDIFYQDIYSSRTETYIKYQTINIWDVKNHECIKTLPNEAALAIFSPDGKYIASASTDNTIRVWDTKSGTIIYSFTGHTGGISSIAYSLDGNYIISSSEDSTIRIWNVNVFNNNIELPSRILNGVLASHLFYSPDGKSYAIADHNTIYVCNSQKGDTIMHMQGHDSTIVLCQYNSKGDKLLSYAEDSTIRIWDMNNYTYLNMQGCDDVIQSAVFSPDGSIIAAFSRRNKVYMWNSMTGMLIDTIRLEGRKIANIHFWRNEDIIISTNNNRDIYIRNIRSAKNRYIHPHLVTILPYACAFAPTGEYFVCASIGNRIEIYNLNSGVPFLTTDRHKGDIRSINFSQSGKYFVSSSEDGTIKIWETETGKCVQTFIGHTRTNIICTAKFSPDESFLISVAMGGETYIWDVNNGGTALVKIDYSAPYGVTQLVSFSPDGEWIILPLRKEKSTQLIHFISLPDMIIDNQKRYKNRSFTPEERRKYSLE